MATNSPYDKEDPFRHPLGLPAGSVRALLTMMVVGVICYDIILGLKPEVVWAETLMVALAHYFTTRRFVQLPYDMLRKLEDDGIVPKEPHPLYLPRGTIRTVILAAFIGTAAYKYQQGQLFQPNVVAVLGALLAYFVGNVLRGIFTWWNRGRATPAPRLWADLRAVLVLGALALVTALHVTRHQHVLPDQTEHIVVALVLFYFGSR